jgi:hypothetical protein
MIIHMVEICVDGKCVEVNKDLFEKALEIRKEAIKRNDLRTRWWVRFIGALFNPVTITGRVTFSFTDIGGTSRSQSTKWALGTNPLITNTSNCNNRFWISVGNGTTPPTIDDFRLGSKIADALASYTLDDTNGIITLSAGFTFTSNTVITEVGLEWECTVSGHDVCGRMLVDRTLLSSPFTAPANVPVTVTYRILL